MLSEQLGPITSAASVYTVCGVLALCRLAWRSDERAELRKLPHKYLFGCGLLFVCYMLQLFLAVGLATNRQQVLEVGLLNYLWPTGTMLLTVLLLGKKARMGLLPGTLLALVGMFLVLTQHQHVSWHSFSTNLATNPPAYALGMTAALSWALYSTLTRKWAARSSTGGVMLFMPATAVLLLACAIGVDEPRVWGVAAISGIAVLGVATFLAYALWDNAMRAGNIVAVVASSYLTPFLSTVLSCLLLSVVPKPQLWIGCGILIAGSLLSGYSVVDLRREEDHHDA